MLTEHRVEISFVKWMLLGVPTSGFILVSLYLVLVKWLYPNHIRPNAEAATYIKDEKIKMGAPTPEEKRVLIIFIGTALLWITKDLIKPYVSTAMDDNIIALIGAMVLFFMPSGLKGRSLLEWEDSKKMPWGIILLFVGGIALAGALEKCGVLKMTGEFLATYSTLGLMGMILIVIMVSIFMSELLSNVAQVIVFAPVLVSLALAMGSSPLYLGIPMTLAASCASMLPMGSPPNAIAFSSGYIPMRQMIKTGFVLNLICIAILFITCVFLKPLVFNLDQ